VEQVANNYLSR